MRKLVIVGLVILGLLGVGAIAYASIPGSNGVINGCYKNSNGALIVIDSAASCPSGYTTLNWNQTGPPGVSDYVVVQRDHTIQAGTDTDRMAALKAFCPAGKKILGGGGGSYSPPGAGWSWRDDVVVQTSQPDGDNAWLIRTRRMGDDMTAGYVIHAYAICGVVAS